MGKINDEYLNFFTLELESTVTPSTLGEVNEKTSMGAFTRQAWLIHQVEFFSHGSWSGSADEALTEMALSTRKDLANMPELTDMGTIAMLVGKNTLYGAGTGFGISEWPKKVHFLPPIIIAAPTLALYFKTSADWVGQQTEKQQVRIGFTAVELKADAWQEVFQTWNFAQ